MEQYIVGLLKIKADKVEEAIAAAEVAASRVRVAEPGVRWEMRQSLDDPTCFYNVETFPDQAAMDFHIDSEHTRKNAEMFEGLFEKEPEVIFCRLIAKA